VLDKAHSYLRDRGVEFVIEPPPDPVTNKESVRGLYELRRVLVDCLRLLCPGELPEWSQPWMFGPFPVGNDSDLKHAADLPPFGQWGTDKRTWREGFATPMVKHADEWRDFFNGLAATLEPDEVVSSNEVRFRGVLYKGFRFPSTARETFECLFRAFLEKEKVSYDDLAPGLEAPTVQRRIDRTREGMKRARPRFPLVIRSTGHSPPLEAWLEEKK